MNKQQFIKEAGSLLGQNGVDGDVCVAGTSVTLLEFVGEAYERCDEAHSFEHIITVMRNGDKLVNLKKLKDNDNIQAVMLGCLLHDIGCRTDRDTHHEISAREAMALLEGTPYNDIRLKVSNACLEHRASGKGRYSSDVSEIVAVADKGSPCIHDIVKRCIQYSVDKYGPDAVKVKQAVLEHLEDKYSSKGYAWKKLGKMGHELYFDEILEVQSLVDDKTIIEELVETKISTFIG